MCSSDLPRHEEAVRIPEDPFARHAQKQLQGQGVGSPCEPVHGSPSAAMQDMNRGDVCLQGAPLPEIGQDFARIVAKSALKALNPL
mgnify:CR=1 FL=1